MEKWIPYEKCSKKKQREMDAKRRGSWGGINPVTRKPPNPKAYNRQKARKWKEDSMSVPFSVFVLYNTSLQDIRHKELCFAKRESLGLKS